MKLFLGALALIVLAGCAGPDSAKALSDKDQPISVQAVTAAEVEEPMTVPILGAVTSSSRSSVGCEIDGQVTALLVREGEHVRAGQALIQLSANDAHAKYSAAEGGLKQATLSAQADEQITAAKLLSAQQDLARTQDKLNSDVKLAESRMAEMQAHYDQLKRGPRPQEIEAANSDVVAAQAVVESDKTTADYAKLVLKRKSSLLGQGGISQNEVDMAQLDYDHAVQSVAFAEQQLRAKQLYLNLLKEGTPREELAQGAAQLAAAKEAYRAANANLASIEDSKQAVLMAQADHDRAASRLKQLESGDLSDEGAKVSLAQQDLARTQIRTPIDGVVSSIKVVRGQVARAGQIVAEVIGQGGVQVEATAMEEDVSKIQRGQRVSLSLRDDPSRHMTGILRDILAPGSEGHSSRIIISIDASDGVRAGQVVTGDVVTSESHHVIKIPADALFSEMDGQADVFVADGETVRERPVQIGEKADGLVTIQSGIAAGDQMVVHPDTHLRDGSRIKVMRVSGGGQ